MQRVRIRRLLKTVGAPACRHTNGAGRFGIQVGVGRWQTEGPDLISEVDRLFQLNDGDVVVVVDRLLELWIGWDLFRFHNDAALCVRFVMRAEDNPWQGFLVDAMDGGDDILWMDDCATAPLPPKVKNCNPRPAVCFGLFSADNPLELIEVDHVVDITVIR